MNRRMARVVGQVIGGVLAVGCLLAFWSVTLADSVVLGADEPAAEVERLIRSGVLQAAKRQGAEEQALAQDGVTLLKALLVRPMAIYVSRMYLDRGSRPVGALSALAVSLPTAFAADAGLADGIYFASSTPIWRPNL